MWRRKWVNRAHSSKRFTDQIQVKMIIFHEKGLFSITIIWYYGVLPFLCQFPLVLLFLLYAQASSSVAGLLSFVLLVIRQLHSNYLRRVVFSLLIPVHIYV